MKVLCAEDNVDEREVLTEVLNSRGYDFTIFRDGEALLVELTAEGVECDLVITDNQMEHMTGLEFLREIRKDSRFDELPIIVLSWDVGIEREVKKLKATFLQKAGGVRPLISVLSRIEVERSSAND